MFCNVSGGDTEHLMVVETSFPKNKVSTAINVPNDGATPYLIKRRL